MKLDATTWSELGELFDELAALAPAERRHRLQQVTLPENTRRWLVELLAAHDAGDAVLVDEALDDVVVRLLEDSAEQPQIIPEAVAGLRFGNWRAIEEIGRGGMGVVLRGERADVQFEKQVAIKLLPPGPAGPETRERFQSEIRLLARLDHPNIAQLLDGGIGKDDIPYLVMEYVDGVPVHRYCKQHKLDLKQRIDLFEHTATAIAYSHRHLIVHCDIKPSNVLVTNEGQVKVVDFGVAARLKGAKETEKTLPGLRCSPAYAAPEQLLGAAPSVAQDVYALGALLYELLTASRIRDGRQTTYAFVGRSVQTDFSPPSERTAEQSDLPFASRLLRGDLDAICLKALAAEPEQRYSSVDALITDVQRWRSARPVAARGGGRFYSAGKWFKRNGWAATVASLFALSLIAGTATALWQTQRARHQAERASLALTESEQALARTEALHEFILDLFRAAQPDRPRDRLPTTEEILALGAERALDEASAPSGERVTMLMTIGQIYRELNQYEQAHRLLENAVMVAREHRDQQPEELALALWQLAVLATAMQDLDQADELLQEAESLIKDDEAHWKTFAKVRTERGWVEYRKGNFAEVINLSEPLHLQMRERGEVTESTRLILLNNMVSAFAELGELSRASEFATEAIELTRASPSMGPESSSYALALNNSVHLEYYLGRFAVAEERSRRAVSLIEQIEDPERPSAARAAMRSRLAHALLYAGYFDEALEQAEMANSERAQSQGIAPDESEIRYYFRGYFLVMMHRWEEAEQALYKARNLFGEAGREDRWSILAVVEALLARTLCHRHGHEQGEAILAELDARRQAKNSGQYPDQPLYRALIFESRAACYFQAGRLDLALPEIDAALALETGYPGRVMHQADRRILRARILAALDRHRQAEQELDQAARAFLDLDLDDHPHLDHVEQARRQLFP